MKASSDPGAGVCPYGLGISEFREREREREREMLRWESHPHARCPAFTVQGPPHGPSSGGHEEELGSRSQGTSCPAAAVGHRASWVYLYAFSLSSRKHRRFLANPRCTQRDDRDFFL